MPESQYLYVFIVFRCISQRSGPKMSQVIRVQIPGPGVVGLHGNSRLDWTDTISSEPTQLQWEKNMKKPWGPDLDTPFFGHAITIHNLGHETFLDLHMIGSVHSCANLKGPHQTPKLLPRRYGTCSCGWEAHGSLQAFLKHLLAWVICWM
jgi:hypothetical protein